MAECAIDYGRGMITREAEINSPKPIGRVEARGLAYAEAENHLRWPMLLAWYDRRKGQHSPPVDCCQGSKPAWVTYAENRGGDLAVLVSGGEFVFIFRDGAID